MKIIRKITVNKKEREIISNFMDICNDWLEITSPNQIWNLLNSIYDKDSLIDVNDTTYDIEYID